MARINKKSLNFDIKCNTMLYHIQELPLMDLIKKLETYRLENRISQKELAKKLSVAFCAVNRWFNRKIKPNKIKAYYIEQLTRNMTSK